MKMLHLTLKKDAFDVMVTGEKNIEYRKPSKWIESRLLDKEGLPKFYNYIKFTNGYGKNRPYFIVKYNCLEQYKGEGGVFFYSNGLMVDLKDGDYKIWLGKIIEKGNCDAV